MFYTRTEQNKEAALLFIYSKLANRVAIGLYLELLRLSYGKNTKASCSIKGVILPELKLHPLFTSGDIF